MRALFVILLFLAMTGPLPAHTVAEESFTCPIDGKDFNQMMDASGTQYGLRLDLKPLGPTAAPWAVPECPKCGFVFFKQESGVVPQPLVEEVKPFILSKEYQNAKSAPSYYRLALLLEFLREDDLAIAQAFLQASWQAEGKPDTAKEYLSNAYPYFRAVTNSPKVGEDDYVYATLMRGELERRLGKFPEAKATFEKAKSGKMFAKPELQAIIARQLEFIGKKDSDPHAANDELEKMLKE